MPTEFNTADYTTDANGQSSGDGTCGNGSRGNGICPVISECCSQYGFCGTTADHCASPPSATTTQATSLSSSDVLISTGGAGGTCGGGQVGNGICLNSNECCSQYGFCGSSSEHCGNLATSSTGAGTTTPLPQTSSEQQQQQEQVYGTCGNGSTGNGICPTNSDCCSLQGFCGTTLEHCTDKVGPTFPGQPDYTASVVASTLPPFDSVQQQQTQQPQPANLGFDGGQITTTTTTYSTVAAATTSVSSNNPPPPTTTTPVNPHGSNKKIIGYYASWQWYDRDKLAQPANMDFRKVQRVNFAFFQPDLLGNVYGTDRWGDPQLLFGPYSSLIEGGVQRCSYDGPNEVNCAYHEQNSGLIYQAHEQGAEVYPSIGEFIYHNIKARCMERWIYMFDLLDGIYLALLNILLHDVIASALFCGTIL